MSLLINANFVNCLKLQFSLCSRQQIDGILHRPVSSRRESLLVEILFLLKRGFFFYLHLLPVPGSFVSLSILGTCLWRLAHLQLGWEGILRTRARWRHGGKKSANYKNCWQSAVIVIVAALGNPPQSHLSRLK